MCCRVVYVVTTVANIELKATVWAAYPRLFVLIFYFSTFANKFVRRKSCWPAFVAIHWYL